MLGRKYSISKGTYVATQRKLQICENFSDNILVGNSEIAYYGPELEINIDSQTVQFCNKVTLYTIFTRFDAYVII